MKTIKIKLFKQVQHEVEMELPAFFKNVFSAYRIEYYKVYESEPNKLKFDEINYFSYSKDYTYYPGRELNKDVCNNVVIDRSEYVEVLGNVYDKIGDELNALTRIEDQDIETETEEDEEIRECFLEAADVAYDQAKYREFEKQNFHNVTREAAL